MKIGHSSGSVIIDTNKLHYKFQVNNIPIDIFIYNILPYLGDNFKGILLTVLYLSSTSKLIRDYINNNYLWRLFYLNYKLIDIQKQYFNHCSSDIHSEKKQRISINNINFVPPLPAEVAAGARAEIYPPHGIEGDNLKIYDIDLNTDTFSMVNTSLHIYNHTNIVYDVYWIQSGRYTRNPLKHMGIIEPYNIYKINKTFTSHRWLCNPKCIPFQIDDINLVKIKSFILKYNDIKWITNKDNSNKFKANIRVDIRPDDMCYKSDIYSYKIITKNFKDFRIRFMR